MENFEDLKVGDVVFYDAGFSRVDLIRDVVKRITKTQIITGRDAKFKRSTGRSVGDSSMFTSRWLLRFTDERDKLCSRRSLLRNLRGCCEKFLTRITLDKFKDPDQQEVLEQIDLLREKLAIYSERLKGRL